MVLSVRKKWLITICLGVFVTCGITLAARAHRFLWLMQTHNDLKQIGLALHQYHDIHGTFPPVVTRDANGNALRSWRTLVEGDLDSIPERSGPYQFLAVVGPSAAWSFDSLREIRDLTDGTSNIALVIGIRNTGIDWPQPIDATVTDTGTALTVNGRQLDLSDDVFVLTADGTVRYAENGIDQAKLSALLTIDAGDEVVSW